jgi:hypothetical protein
MPDAFFGQHSQMDPVGPIAPTARGRALATSGSDTQNMTTTSAVLIRGDKETFGGKGASQSTNSFGAPMVSTLDPSKIPIFFANGVPE